MRHEALDWVGPRFDDFTEGTPTEVACPTQFPLARRHGAREEVYRGRGGEMRLWGDTT
jgi:hypothetical protein